MRSVPLRLWALAVLSAALEAIPFPFTGPAPEWARPFCWICLVPLLIALMACDRAGKPLRPFASASLGYANAVVWYLLNCYWIFPTMHRYGGLSTVAAVGVLLLFALYLGLYGALFGLLFAWLRSGWGRTVALAIAPLLWVGVELARARITGFPWDLLGYTQVDNSWLTRLAPFTGVFGLSLVIAFVNAVWATPVVTRKRAPLLFVAAAMTAAGIWLQFDRPADPNSPTAQAVLLQDNLSVGAEAPKHPESRDQLLLDFAQLSLHPTAGATSGTAGVDLIVWPEAPADLLDADPSYRNFMGELARKAQAPVIADDVSVGPRTENGSYGLYNSDSFFRADGSYAGRYDKMHLVPFGEYVPYRSLFFFTGHLLDGLPFVPGLQRRVFDTGVHKYGVFICYESIFGDEIRQFVAEGAQVLVNTSDDGWYGDSSAPWEHLDMVRMRAIENHRWVLRSTNTGVTASIDPEGRIRSQMPRHVRGSLLAGFGYENDETFYTRHGDWIAWLCAIVTALMLGAGLARKQAAASKLAVGAR